jgi:hypothetical protein
MRTGEQVVAELRARGELWESAPGLVGLRGDVLHLYERILRRRRPLRSRSLGLRSRRLRGLRGASARGEQQGQSDTHSIHGLSRPSSSKKRPSEP